MNGHALTQHTSE